jgi:hypothetical protein
MILPPAGRAGQGGLGHEPQGLRAGLPSFGRWRGLNQDPESVQRHGVMLPSLKACDTQTKGRASFFWCK